MQRPRLAASCCSKRRRCGGAGDGPLAERIAGFLLNGYFFVALILYAALTVLWVWILSFTSSRAAIRSSRLHLRSRQRLVAEPLSMRL